MRPIVILVTIALGAPTARATPDEDAGDTFVTAGVKVAYVFGGGWSAGVEVSRLWFATGIVAAGVAVGADYSRVGEAPVWRVYANAEGTIVFFGYEGGLALAHGAGRWQLGFQTGAFAVVPFPVFETESAVGYFIPYLRHTFLAGDADFNDAGLMLKAATLLD